MPESALDVAEQLLEKDEDIFVPIKKVWVKVRDDHGVPVPPLEEFAALIKQDERFEVIEISPKDHLYEGWSQEEIEEDIRQMESLGFYEGDRVKLCRIEMTPEKMAEILARKVDNMMNPELILICHQDKIGSG
jgi:hypothetical protein